MIDRIKKIYNDYFEAGFSLVQIFYILTSSAIFYIFSKNPPPVVHLYEIMIYLIILIVAGIMPIIFIYLLMNNLFKVDGHDKIVVISSALIIWISILTSAIYGKPEILTAGATIILVIVTGYTITQTRINAEKMREEEIKPRINIILKERYENVSSSASFPLKNQYHGINTIGFLDLIIENYGKGAANNIQFEIVKPKNGSILGKISILPYFQAGINSISPGKELLLHSFNRLDINQNTIRWLKDYQNLDNYGAIIRDFLILDFSVTYEDIEGKSYEYPFKRDFYNYMRDLYPLINSTAPIDTSPPTDP